MTWSLALKVFKIASDATVTFNMILAILQYCLCYSFVNSDIIHIQTSFEYLFKLIIIQ